MSVAKLNQVLLSGDPRYIHDPSGTVPLAGELKFKTETPAWTQITATATDHVVVVPSKDEPATDHCYPILGLRPARSYTLSVEIVGETGAKDDWQGTIVAPALPDDLPPIDVTVSDQDKMESGVTLFGIRKSYQQGGVNKYGYIVAIDADGEVVWLRNCGHMVGDLIETAAGTLVYLTFDNQVVEIDMLGNVLNIWTARDHPALSNLDYVGPAPIELDVAALHHEILELPNGNFVALGAEVRNIDNYPISESDPKGLGQTTPVVGDQIVEFTRAGNIVHRFDLFDILDPFRLCYDSLGGYWRKKGFAESADWSHANAIDYLAEDDSLTVSVRHQDAVIKIRRTTGELLWILGPHENWQDPWAKKLLVPVGDLDWQYHQHDVRWTGSGTLTLFDNGNHRAVPPATPMTPAESYSRAVEFRINETTGTVEQLWEYRGGYSAFISSARKMTTTGNMLINFGGILETPGGEPTANPQEGIAHIHMVEVSGEDGTTPVFELRIDQRDIAKGWDSYRADRIPSLYLRSQ